MTVPSGEVTVLMSWPPLGEEVQLNVTTAGTGGTHRSSTVAIRPHRRRCPAGQAHHRPHHRGATWQHRRHCGGGAACSCQVTPRAHPERRLTYGNLRWCPERRQVVMAFWLALAAAAIVCGRLIRRAWTCYRWDSRPRRHP